MSLPYASRQDTSEASSVAQVDLEITDNGGGDMLPESPLTFDKLWKWNLGAGIAHLIQAILMLACSQVVERIKNFKTPLTTSFLTYNETCSCLVTDVKNIGYVHIGPVTAVFLFLSAVAHFIIISPCYFKKYEAEIRRGINSARWYEYAVSSSLMIALIAMLFGVYDLATLLLLITCNASMNFFGLLMEELNQHTSSSSIIWSPFIFGCFAGVMPWVVVLMFFLGGGNYSDIPGFVYGIFGAYLFFFNTFPVNMVLQYKKIGKWADYRYGEWVYIILSLSSKSLLAWIVFGGTQQPQAETP